MTAVTHAEFHADTLASDVAKAFAGSIRGRNIIVTGVNRGGIGFTTAQAFASQSPTHIIITGRSPTKLQESIEALQQEYPNVHYAGLKLDLSSQKSVREAAAELLAMEDIPTIDILVNNAGVMLIPERTLSEDGIEMHFATNHVGHFLFTNLILPKLIKAAEGKPKGITRVVNVSSSSPLSAGVRFSDINFDKVNKTLPEDEQPQYEALKHWGEKEPENKSYFPREGYNQSKVANLLFSIGFNARYYDKYGLLSLAVNPGVIATELQRNFPPELTSALEQWAKSGALHIKTQGAGAATSLVAATDPGLSLPVSKDGKENFGAYLSDCQINDGANARAVSNKNADRLWILSEELVGESFSH
ncbi:uncharacterized protein Z520_08954 [Fonsecaea multimorphosa CBS 102226]|uniref:Short-chain dehydrogenase n=1 Tax=Fonsecaea multimorphosa CBS 102226 TaxID=1442371 RepID=A0A0D2JQ21_9EURO|nr:uncharacterized protein Z520_08954 [Fonsecaea multimorphosa CBS 102226]KIX95437.1 hypothetical protein Z520_08954 [Fonsecaea multimorphosa CBS 102226]OAL20969.1 hypothetical protein AYO22_08389 [Fonsecaea multimorphosa]